VNLGVANLKNTCLVGAQLDSANRQLAEEKGAIFNWGQFLRYNQSLLHQNPVEEFSEADFLDTHPDNEIQIVEGEPLFPSAWDTYPRERNPNIENQWSGNKQKSELGVIIEDDDDLFVEEDDEDNDKTLLVKDYLEKLPKIDEQNDNNEETLVF
jgi:hypothetical protein